MEERDAADLTCPILSSPVLSLDGSEHTLVQCKCITTKCIHWEEWEKKNTGDCGLRAPGEVTCQY